MRCVEPATAPVMASIGTILVQVRQGESCAHDGVSEEKLAITHARRAETHREAALRDGAPARARFRIPRQCEVRAIVSLPLENKEK